MRGGDETARARIHVRVLQYSHANAGAVERAAPGCKLARVILAAKQVRHRLNFWVARHWQTVTKSILNCQKSLPRRQGRSLGVDLDVVQWMTLEYCTQTTTG